MGQIDYNPLLVVTGILVGLQVIWAQFWASQGRKTADKQTSATLGLYWTYVAIIIAMSGLAMLLIGKYWEGTISWPAFELGFSFFITSFLMGMANMAESLLSLITRVRGRETAFDSNIGIETAKLNGWLLLRIAGIVVLLFIVSILGVLFSHWLWWSFVVVALLAFWQYSKLISKVNQ